MRRQHTQNTHTHTHTTCTESPTLKSIRTHVAVQYRATSAAHKKHSYPALAILFSVEAETAKQPFLVVNLEKAAIIWKMKMRRYSRKSSSP